MEISDIAHFLCMISVCYFSELIRKYIRKYTEEYQIPSPILE